MTNCEAVEAYIREHGSITSIECIEKLRFTRLSAAIFILKKRGVPIITERVDTVNQYGNPSFYHIYRIKE